VAFTCEVAGVLLFHRGNWREHRPWFLVTVVLFVLALIWFLLASWGQGDWPSGSSWPGFTFGVAGGLIILFEAFLWPRKRLLRVWRIGRTQSWLRAHIWLGLLVGPLLLLHSGLRWGGTLSTVLSLLLIAVILSGIWGLIVQQQLPRMLLAEVPAETIYSQIGYLSSEMTQDARRLVRAVCGAAPGEEGPETAVAHEEEVRQLVVGAVRSAGRVQGKVLATQAPREPIPESQAMRGFFESHLETYLRRGADSGSPLATETNSRRMFDDLRTNLPPAAHDVASALEGYADQRRQWDYQGRLHFWLHNWLVVHFAASVALIVLMLIHAYVAIKYW
jgi:hypothetical protein